MFQAPLFPSGPIPPPPLSPAKQFWKQLKRLCANTAQGRGGRGIWNVFIL